MAGSVALRVSLAIIVAVCAAFPARSAAQVVTSGIQTVPPRDRVPMPTTGTGVIKGRVVDGVNGAAIVRARVRLTGGGGQRPSVLTDAGGAFSFTGLPRGAFTLMVEKSTYMGGRFPEGGRTLRSSMKPLVLADGRVIDDLTLRLFRGSAIAGRVFDASGDPVEYADVRLLRLSSAGGRPTVRSGSNTNDLGEFRIPRLEAGSYVVMVTPRRTGPDESLLNVQPAAQPVPTYYPGALSLDQAQPIKIERGQAVSDVDVTLAEGVPAIVSGTIVGEDGQPAGPGAYIMARTAVRDAQMPLDMGGTSVRQDGTFRLQLAPGEYVLEARASTRVTTTTTTPVGGFVTGVVGSVPGGLPQDTERFGTAHITVAGNLDGVIIVLGRGATASGRIIFEGTSPLPPVPPAGQFRLPLFSSEGPGCRQGQTTVQADWTFRVEGLGGTCSAAPQVGFGQWILKSVIVDGDDLLNETITFESGQRLRNMQVVFSDRRSEVTFNVADENGQAMREYVGILLPMGKGTPQPSSVRTYVPLPPELTNRAALNRPTGAPGLAPQVRRESLGGLRPGDYYAIAIDDIGTEEVRDPAVLARLIAAATRVTLGDTPSTTVSLRRQKLADILKR